MAKTTPNYGLTKPEANDFYNIETFNENMDKLDEKTVGKSPVYLTSADDLNQIRNTGLYYWRASVPLNAPSGDTTNMRDMRVWSTDDTTFSSGACFQELLANADGTTGGCMMQRTLKGDVVGEWEWVNPPMVVNHEYRTVERYKNEAVYVMLKSDGIVHKRTESGLDITPITYGKTDLVEGESALATGCFYFVYE